MGKSWISSRTVWVGVIAAVIELANTLLGVAGTLPEGVSSTITGILATALPVLMVVMRLITSEPIKEVWKG